MGTTSKRLILFAAGVVLLIVVALLWRAPLGSGHYRTKARVLATPYTNTFLSRAFEKQIVKSIPGVLGLRVTPFVKPLPGVPLLPNGVMFEIITVGPTAADAEEAAYEAATRLCQTVLTNYGATGEIVDKGHGTRKYSFLDDSLKPAVARLFAN